MRIIFYFLLFCCLNVSGIVCYGQKPEAGRVLTLKIQTNTECNIVIDNEQKGNLKTNDFKNLSLPQGVHKIVAQPLNKEYETLSTSFEVTNDMLDKTNVISLELAKKTDLQVKDAPVEENWFMRAVNNIIDKHKLSW